MQIEDFSILWDGQQYRLIGPIEHVSKIGERSTWVAWETECARCSATFRVTTPPEFHNPTRRCSECKMPGVSVKTARKLMRKQIKGAP